MTAPGGPPTSAKVGWLLVRTRIWVLRAAYVACVIAFLIEIGGYYRKGLGLTPLIVFGDAFADRALAEVRATPHYVFPGGGYDGQFYAQLAVRPIPWDPEVHDALDNPWYRSGRILPSLVAAGLSFGRPSWALNVYAGQFVVVWLLCALLLLRWFPPDSLSNFVAWAGTLFSAGLMMAVCRSVPDAWALLLILLGLALWERHSAVAPFVLGLSGLAKETSLAAVTVFFDAVPRDRASFIEFGRRLALAAAPTLAWLGLMRLIGGGYTLTDAFTYPFAGLVERISAALGSRLGGGWYAMLVDLSAPIAIVAQALFFVLRWRPRDYRWRLGIVYVPLIAFFGRAVWEGYPSASARVLLPLLLAFNLALPRGLKWTPLLVLGNLSALSGIDILAGAPP